MAPKSVPKLGEIFAVFVPLKSSLFPHQGPKMLFFFWDRPKMQATDWSKFEQFPGSQVPPPEKTLTLRLLNALNSEDRGLKVRFSLATIAFDRESAQMSQILSSQGKNAPSNPYPHYLVRLATSRKFPKKSRNLKRSFQNFPRNLLRNLPRDSLRNFPCFPGK